MTGICTIDQKEEIESLVGSEFLPKAEYSKMRVWRMYAIRDFLKTKNWLGVYEFKSLQKSFYDQEYRTVIRYHSDDY